MIIFNYLLKYNWIFRYYLLILFFFNLILFYIFAIKRFFNNEQVDNTKQIDTKQIDTKQIDTKQIDTDLDLKYCLMFKKIINIINNPIIFDYQLEQSQKINIISDKYIQYHKYLLEIHNYKFTKSYIYYKKAKKKLSIYYKSDIEKNNILTKLFCINFQ